MKIKISISSQESIFNCWLAIVPLLYTPIIYYITYVVGMYNILLADISKAVIYLLLGYCVVRSFKVIFISIDFAVFLFLLWFLVQYFLQFIINPGHYGFYMKLLIESALGFFFFIIAKSINDYESFYKVLRYGAVIVLFFCFFYLIGGGVTVFKSLYGKSYNQAISYCFLLAPCVFIIDSFAQPNIRNIILTILSITISVLLGTRGVLICIAFAILMCLFIDESNLEHNKRKVYLFLLVIIGMIHMYINFEALAKILLDIEQIIGGNGRILNKLLSGSFTDAVTRDYIREVAIEKIREHWLLGTGIATDRLVLTQGLAYNQTTYCHNFFLEILLQYGIIFGSLILIFFLFYLFRCFVSTSGNTYQRKSYVVLIVLGFIPLIMSSSYLQWMPFFILIGFTAGFNNEGKASVGSNE